MHLGSYNLAVIGLEPATFTLLVSTLATTGLKACYTLSLHNTHLSQCTFFVRNANYVCYLVDWGVLAKYPGPVCWHP